MSSKEWLAALKPGDEVCTNDRLVKVTRVTSTQIVTSESLRYNRTTGKRCGTSGWHSSWLSEVTPEFRDRAVRRSASHKIRHTDMTHVPTATLVAMVALYENALGELGK